MMFNPIKVFNLIKENLFVPIEHELKDWDGDIKNHFNSEFITNGEPIFVTDPVYLDYYNDIVDLKQAKDSYIFKHGVIFSSFGGATVSSLYWFEPYLFLPNTMEVGEYDDSSDEIDSLSEETLVQIGLELQSEEDLVNYIQQYYNEKMLVEEIGCDGGTFVFLPVFDDIPEDLMENINTLVSEHNGFILNNLPAGRWSAFYEQHQVEGWEENNPHLRNLILKWSKL